MYVLYLYWIGQCSGVSDMVRKTQAETQKTYRQLIESALALFRRQGVANTTIEQIARNADVTRGAVYWHFDNKEAIVRALWEDYVYPLIRRLQVALRDLDPERPGEHFREILLITLNDLMKQQETALAVRILLRSVEFCEQQTELQSIAFTQRREIHETLVTALERLRLEGHLASDLPAEILAGGLLSYLHGLLDMNLMVDSPVCVVDDIPQLLDLFLDGMLRPSTVTLGDR